ncbi:MAG TPA: HAD hydrolase family protein [Longimicrobiales bacterium]|nr:HAD hydrolase family protein [Longimicrobiales bacterium]
MSSGPVADLPEERARRVRLVVFDVDGVLTDAGVYMGRLASGEEVELKRFDIQDGLGIKFLQWAGLEVALVSGRVSESTDLRARELGVEECHQAAGAEKLPVVTDLLERKSVGWDEVAMLADDLPDMAVFARVGLPVAVANAQPEIVERAAWRTRASGGRGAVREFCRALLRARGQWDDVIGSYVSDRGGTS